jgi:cytochrome c oxidase assembly protein subunit 15
MYKPGGKRRKDLVWLSAILPFGVVMQAVIGGIVVLTRLNPALVSVLFLLSAAIILPSAIVLHVRVDEGAGRAHGLVRTDLRVLTGLLVAVTAVMLAAGTVVTGTGPLAGTTIDSHGHVHSVPRYHFNLEAVTQAHADIGWFIGAIAVAVVVGLWFSPGVPRISKIYGLFVMCALGVQGIIGYVQYFNHLPAGLVWVHVSWAVVLWIFVLRLYLSTRERMPADEDAAARDNGAAGVSGEAGVSGAETSPARSASAR